jgi:hypothetical protein
MDKLIAALAQLLVAVLDGVREVANAIVSVVALPVSWLGMSPEWVLAAVVVIVFIVSWRTIGGNIT